ncbi:hypothetical protein, partial [Granulicella sibirica]|uniref:hypothetical protein n=1 Tax=Granulicella sibirica TaxID=2479048 RepID=UPI0019D53AB1
PERKDTQSGPPQPPARNHGSLTKTDPPPKNHRNLFKQTEPPLWLLTIELPAISKGSVVASGALLITLGFVQACKSCYESVRRTEGKVTQEVAG